MEKGKRGPQSDSPKSYRIAVKMDEHCKKILDEYCEQKQVNQMEAARRGILRLEDDLEK